jgi:hypothetical protein
MKEKLLWAGIGALLGIVFAPQLSKLPLINKIPTV